MAKASGRATHKEVFAQMWSHSCYITEIYMHMCVVSLNNIIWWICNLYQKHQLLHSRPCIVQCVNSLLILYAPVLLLERHTVTMQPKAHANAATARRSENSLHQPNTKMIMTKSPAKSYAHGEKKRSAKRPKWNYCEWKRRWDPNASNPYHLKWCARNQRDRCNYIRWNAI